MNQPAAGGVVAQLGKDDFGALQPAFAVGLDVGRGQGVGIGVVVVGPDLKALPFNAWPTRAVPENRSQTCPPVGSRLRTAVAIGSSRARLEPRYLIMRRPGGLARLAGLPLDRSMGQSQQIRSPRRAEGRTGQDQDALAGLGQAVLDGGS